MMLRITTTSRQSIFPYLAGTNAIHLLMTIMNSLHLHETAENAPALYRKVGLLLSCSGPFRVVYLESKTWKAPSSVYVYNEVTWFVPLFLIAISVATIYRSVYRSFLTVV